MNLKIKNTIKRIDSIGEDFIKNLTSKNMLTTYVFGAALFVVLRQFFNWFVADNKLKTACGF